MNVLALCAGIGGLELGLHLAEPGANPIVFVEQDAWCRGILAARWPGVPIWDDVLSFDPEPWRGQIDVLTAGFPCQPWSVAGKRQGTSDERWIWPQIATIIRVVGPRWVLLENVPALIAGGGLSLVAADLAEMGLSAEWGVFSCAALGASHRRERVFVLAYAQGQQLRQGRAASSQRQRGPLRLGSGVADSDSQRQQGERSLRQRGAKAYGTSSGLGYADGSGLAQRQEQPYEQQSAPVGASREIWAPDKLADWRDIDPAHWPKQSLCRVVDGVSRRLEPDRKHRLRALGNAVSPPVAAMAWTVLKARLTGEVI